MQQQEQNRVDLEEFLNSPLIQQAREPLPMVKAGIQSYFQQGHVIPEDAQELPEGTVIEDTETASFNVNMEKVAEWCSSLPWLEVPDDQAGRARWILEYQYGKEAVEHFSDIHFNERGGIEFVEEVKVVA